MMNEFNPDGKDIRFIDSHYRDLFRIPDGGTIQVHYSDDSVVIKPCKFIDHYEYADRVDDKKSNIVEIYHDLTNGNAAPYRDFLEQVIEDSDEISVVQAATQLKNELDKAVSRPKESVIDQLKQISGQTVPSKMSHSFKEPER